MSPLISFCSMHNFDLRPQTLGNPSQLGQWRREWARTRSCCTTSCLESHTKSHPQQYQQEAKRKSSSPDFLERDKRGANLDTHPAHLKQLTAFPHSPRMLSSRGLVPHNLGDLNKQQLAVNSKQINFQELDAFPHIEVKGFQEFLASHNAWLESWSLTAKRITHSKREKRKKSLHFNMNKKENYLSHACLQNQNHVYYLLERPFHS